MVLGQDEAMRHVTIERISWLLLTLVNVDHSDFSHGLLPSACPSSKANQNDENKHADNNP